MENVSADGHQRYRPHPPGPSCVETEWAVYGYLPRLDGLVCANAEAATDLVGTEERPSRSTADALRATARDVCLRFLPTLFTSFALATTPTTSWCVFMSVRASRRAIMRVMLLVSSARVLLTLQSKWTNFLDDGR